MSKPYLDAPQKKAQKKASKAAAGMEKTELRSRRHGLAMNTCADCLQADRPASPVVLPALCVTLLTEIYFAAFKVGSWLDPSARMQDSRKLMANGLTVLWANLTRSTRHGELPEPVSKICDYEEVSSFADVKRALDGKNPDFVIFDFDYPHHKSLRLVADVKREHPGVPMVMFTVQHSEALAVWAFRNKLLDYFVKPIPASELESCLDSLAQIKAKKSSRNSRRIIRPTGASSMVELTAFPDTFDDVLGSAVRYVEDFYFHEIHNEQMAVLCNLDVFQFSRRFKQTYGIGFNEYVTRYRLLQARRLLVNQQANITHTSLAVGFNDPSYFARVFKSYFGAAPSQFVGEPFDETDEIVEVRPALPPLVAPRKK